MEVDPPTYALVLLATGPGRMEVMKLVRRFRPDLSPAEAKTLVDSDYPVIHPAVSHYDLPRVRQWFEYIGAFVEARRNPPGVAPEPAWVDGQGL